MTITTQFNVGATVWFVDNTTLGAQSNTVKNIHIKVDSTTTSIRYELTETDIRDESKLFATQTALANSFNPL